jgi:hypothetical protein
MALQEADRFDQQTGTSPFTPPSAGPDPARAGWTPARLRDRTEPLYPGGSHVYLRSAELLLAYYEDQAIEITRKKLGFKHNSTSDPITANYLKRIVDTLAVTYDQPPDRRLMDADDVPLKDDDPVVELLEDILEDSSYDAFLRKLDAYRTLLGTVCIRTYADDAQQRLKFRLFAPTQFLRDPTPGYEDDVSHDCAIALQLRAGCWELWERARDGDPWSCRWVDERGNEMGSPFGEDPTNPYPVLPIQLVHDQLPMGDAFMPLHLGDITFQENINRVLNTVPDVADLQAYDMMVYETNSPEVGAEIATGPREMAIIPQGDKLSAVPRNPKLVEAMETADRIIDQWLIVKNIPIDYFKGSTKLSTGSAIRIQLWPLIERRNEMHPLVVREQRDAFDIIRCVWNAHCGSWGQDPLDDSVTLDIQMSEMNIPTDPDKLRDIGFREIAAGLSSTIEYLMDKHSLTRQQAIERYEQIKGDNDVYPPVINTNSMVDGPPEAMGKGSATVPGGAFNPDVTIQQSPPATGDRG